MMMMMMMTKIAWDDMRKYNWIKARNASDTSRDEANREYID